MIYGRFLGALALTAYFVSPALTANEVANSRGSGNGRKGFSKKAGSTGTAVSVSSASATAASAAASSTASATSSSGGSSSGGSSAGGDANQLDPANVQSNSDFTGLTDSGKEAGQSASATDAANFINFCQGKTLTNGLQVKAGSCNGIVMGDIPATSNMVSTIILDPQPGQNVATDTTFKVTLQTSGLAAGTFTNPDSTYYAAPQQLKNGEVVGHTHVTIQTLGNSITPSTAPDPSKFAFFKGINDAGNGQGLLAATVTGGLPAGNYRVCTMSSSSNHQPVLMPVAQRGAQDDCTKFTVGGDGGNGGNSGNDTGSTGGGSAASVTGSTGSAATTTAAAGSASSTTGVKGTGARKGSKIGNQSGAGGRPKFAKRAFVA